MNQPIYITIIEQYYRNELSVIELAEAYRNELRGYEHHTHNRVITFTNPTDAIHAILESEAMAHLQAKNV